MSHVILYEMEALPTNLPALQSFDCDQANYC
jgi:hypothetical protein